ncbi:MAG: hypothetical protein HYT77_04095 [Deltaproteobacteria bacterium]|nr:hypothetical protein [Deltaproteobacteria bacterium]
MATPAREIKHFIGTSFFSVLFFFALFFFFFLQTSLVVAKNCHFEEKNWSLQRTDHYGIIDEVRIYNRAMDGLDLCNSYLSFCYSAQEEEDGVRGDQSAVVRYFRSPFVAS